MATLLIPPRIRFVDSNGNALSLGKVYTYEAGTTTPKTSWKNQDESTPNANPIILDSQGYADIWGDGSYKINLTDSSDVQISGWPIDDINLYDPADFTGLTATIGDLNSTTTTGIQKAIDYTISLTDRGKTILVDTTTGDITINLLALATATNRYKITIKKIDVSTNKVIIDASAAELIDGQTTFNLYDYNDFIEILDDGNQWRLVSSQVRGTTRSITTVQTLTLDDNKKTILCDATGGAFAVNLPSAATVGRGYKVTIKKTDASTNAITITPAGGELIDGASTLIEKSQYGASSLISTGTGWSIYSEFGIDVKTPLQKDDMYGILISNGTDTLNDIDFHSGKCRDNADSDNLELTTTWTKQMDTNWVAGNNAGGRPTGVPYSNDTWYNCFVIAKPDGTTDAGFDTSVTATNLLADATGYTLFRRVGSIRTTAAPAAISILQFVAREIGGFIREFWFTASPPPSLNGNINANTASTALSLLYVPAGVITKAILNVHITYVSSQCEFLIFEPAVGGLTGVPHLITSATANLGASTFYVTTNGATPAVVNYLTSGGAGNVNIVVYIGGWQEFVRTPS